LDDRALELREHAEHLEERLAGRRAGVDALAIEAQVNPGAVQLAKKADKVLQATAEPVDAPGRDDVELAPRDRPVQAIESRPLVAPIRAAHSLVAKLSHDAPAAPLQSQPPSRAAGSRPSARRC
jgi:hypothetical protein